MQTPPLLSSLMGIALMTLTTLPAEAAEFKIDPAHSFINFSISHLGISVLKGRFNTIDGHFNYDATKPNAASIRVNVATASIDTNHAERDKHLKSKDFLDVDQFPQATLNSTKYTEKDQKGTLEGNLTLHGITHPVTIPVVQVGAGPDPWGGFRQGFQGTLTLKRSDYGITHNLGPAAETMTLELYIEGIRQ